MAGGEYFGRVQLPVSLPVPLPVPLPVYSFRHCGFPCGPISTKLGGRGNWRVGNVLMTCHFRSHFRFDGFQFLPFLMIFDGFLTFFDGF